MVAFIIISLQIFPVYYSLTYTEVCKYLFLMHIYASIPPGITVVHSLISQIQSLSCLYWNFFHPFSPFSHLFSPWGSSLLQMCSCSKTQLHTHHKVSSRNLQNLSKLSECKIMSNFVFSSLYTLQHRIAQMQPLFNNISNFWINDKHRFSALPGAFYTNKTVINEYLFLFA